MIVIALNPGCKAAIVSVNGAAAAGTGVAASVPIVPLLVGSSLFMVIQADNDDTPISAQ